MRPFLFQHGILTQGVHSPLFLAFGVSLLLFHYWGRACGDRRAKFHFSAAPIDAHVRERAAYDVWAWICAFIVNATTLLSDMTRSFRDCPFYFVQVSCYFHASLLVIPPGCIPVLIYSLTKPELELPNSRPQPIQESPEISPYLHYYGISCPEIVRSSPLDPSS